MMQSKYTRFSLGYVADDKPRTTDEIVVYPIEVLPNRSGDLMENQADTVDITGIDDAAMSVTVNKTKLIKASWLPDGEGNRVTSPDVRKGEIVSLFNMAGSDEYYWNVTGVYPKLRKMEDVLYYWRAIPKLDTESELSETGYWVRVNTYDKYIHMETTDKNGEQSTYKIIINAGDGVIYIEDKQKNSIELQSVPGIMTINLNKEFTVNAKEVINLNTTVCNVNASDAINMKGGNQINLETKAFTLNASDSIDIKTNTYNSKSSNTKIDGGDVTITSNVKLG